MGPIDVALAELTALESASLDKYERECLDAAVAALHDAQRPEPTPWYVYLAFVAFMVLSLTVVYLGAALTGKLAFDWNPYIAGEAGAGIYVLAVVTVVAWRQR